jgi:hypothetical protein
MLAGTSSPTTATSDDIGITDNVFEFGADPLRAEMAAAKIGGGQRSRLVIEGKPEECSSAPPRIRDGTRAPGSRCI